MAWQSAADGRRSAATQMGVSHFLRVADKILWQLVHCALHASLPQGQDLDAEGDKDWVSSWTHTVYHVRNTRPEDRQMCTLGFL